MNILFSLLATDCTFQFQLYYTIFVVLLFYGFQRHVLNLSMLFSFTHIIYVAKIYQSVRHTECLNRVSKKCEHCIKIVLRHDADKCTFQFSPKLHVLRWLVLYCFKLLLCMKKNCSLHTFETSMDRGHVVSKSWYQISYSAKTFWLLFFLFPLMQWIFCIGCEKSCSRAKIYVFYKFLNWRTLKMNRGCPGRNLKQKIKKKA